MTKVLVLGGGYAGLAFIQGLRRTRVPNLEITLVDRNPYHTLLTETHSVAAGTRLPSLVEVEFSALGPGVRVVIASVSSVDRERRLVTTDAGALPYDFLAFCLGGRDADFGIPGVREHALFLRGIADAARIRERLDRMPEGGSVVVVGGGLTGVELAAEMAIRQRRPGRITLVEAAPSLLPGLPESVRDRARRRLGWLGVNVATDARVSRVDEGRVALADGSVLAAHAVVWAAGVQGHPLLAGVGLALDRSGRALVDARLQAAPEIYVLGDSAAYAPAPGAPALPPSAQLAEQMGFAAAADLAASLRGRVRRPFVPHLKGVLCDLGGLNAAGLVYRFQVHGLFGAAAKRVSVLGHLWRTTGLTGLLIHLGEQAQALRRNLILGPQS